MRIRYAIGMVLIIFNVSACTNIQLPPNLVTKEPVQREAQPTPRSTSTPNPSQGDNDPLCLSDDESRREPSCIKFAEKFTPEKVKISANTDVFFLNLNDFIPYESCRLVMYRNLRVLQRRTDMQTGIQHIIAQGDFYSLCTYKYNSNELAANASFMRTPNRARYEPGGEHYLKIQAQVSFGMKKYAEAWDFAPGSNAVLDSPFIPGRKNSHSQRIQFIGVNRPR